MLDAWLALLQALPPGGRFTLPAGEPIESFLNRPTAELVKRGLPRSVATNLKRPDASRLKQWRRWLAASTHHLVTLDSDHYPETLRALSGAPIALWLHGNDPAWLADPQVAVVGSRGPTAGGRANATRFSAELSRRGLTVTSGLAIGIDAASHEGALQQTGSTIAVLGSGIDTIYPRSNSRLARRILESGLLVSEYPPGTPPRRHQFPERNRIIAGLSAGALVIEATRRSGSLITAQLAAEYGREVFAVPGSIHNPLARGCHALIRDGAKLVEDIDHILVELAPQLVDRAQPEPPARQPLPSDPGQAKLLEHMAYEPITAAALAIRAGLTPGEVSSMLLHLEIRGDVEALPGARYSRLLKRI